MISEGGTEYGHMVTIARASSPWGPFEPCPRNPILTHRDTPLSQPIQATGHADLVEDGEGNWWMVFLGIRPQGGYYWHHLGRETFLAPVRWDAQGWPVVNEGKPIALTIALDMQVRGLPAQPTPAAPVRDDFDGPLGPAWNFLRNPVRASYSTTERRGWLTLHGTAVTLDQDNGVSPTFVGRRQDPARAHTRRASTSRRRARAKRRGWCSIGRRDTRYELGVRRSGAGARGVRAADRRRVPLDGDRDRRRRRADGPLILQIEAEPTRYTFAWGTLRRSRHLQPLGTRRDAPPGDGGHGRLHRDVRRPVRAGAERRRRPAPAAFDWFDYEKHE